MILGVGTDIADVKRIQKAFERSGDRFGRRLFSKTEIEYCESRAIKYQCYAARFAAKEAFMKAFGQIEELGFPLTDIEVKNSPNGKPEIALSGKARLAYKKLGAKGCHLSITHTEAYANAIVILEK